MASSLCFFLRASFSWQKKRKNTGDTRIFGHRESDVDMIRERERERERERKNKKEIKIFYPHLSMDSIQFQREKQNFNSNRCWWREKKFFFLFLFFSFHPLSDKRLVGGNGGGGDL